MRASEINREHLIGSVVYYHPIIDRPERRGPYAITDVWALGHGALVARLKGEPRVSGGVSLEALELADDARGRAT